jgi:hypothetical protein
LSASPGFAFVAIGLAAQSARRQPKKQLRFDKTQGAPAKSDANHAREAQAAACGAWRSAYSAKVGTGFAIRIRANCKKL